ncbi:TPA: DNA cytosine methyltransferase [Pseudomonas aeruginosa]|nr:DNA cytosine methyltransferase [Pseudomonas aeruginosa]
MNWHITYGSVCSGIEAASVAWHMLGFRASWFAEIEPFPSAVLAQRWPAVPNLGDMTKLAREVLLGIIAAPLILVGGTPCQDFSVAGMRAGLAGERGALTMKFVELADAIDHVRPDGDECVVVWENVPGVLSDKGNAFGNFLAALVGESEALEPSGPRWTNAGCVYGPRRAAAWRVLDAQYFGLAQRRKRVFVVASARADFDPAAVLLEREGLRRDHPPRRGEGQDLAGRAPFGPALHANAGGQVAVCITGDITHTLKAEGFDASEDGTGRGQPIVADVAPTLRSVNFRSHSNPATQADSLVIASAVRRLTPRECERLQGFPDDYTLIPWRGKPAEECPDGPRYKAIGNSKAVPVVRWIGRRLLQQLERTA